VSAGLDLEVPAYGSTRLARFFALSLLIMSRQSRVVVRASDLVMAHADTRRPPEVFISLRHHRPRFHNSPSQVSYSEIGDTEIRRGANGPGVDSFRVRTPALSFLTLPTTEISEFGKLRIRQPMEHPAAGKSSVLVAANRRSCANSAITRCSLAVSQHFMCWRMRGRSGATTYLYYWLQRIGNGSIETSATGSNHFPTIGLRLCQALPHQRVQQNIEVQKQISSALAFGLDITIFANGGGPSKTSANKSRS
jgi:hypothetical protein